MGYNGQSSVDNARETTTDASTGRFSDTTKNYHHASPLSSHPCARKASTLDCHGHSRETEYLVFAYHGSALQSRHHDPICFEKPDVTVTPSGNPMPKAANDHEPVSCCLPPRTWHQSGYHIVQLGHEQSLYPSLLEVSSISTTINKSLSQRPRAVTNVWPIVKRQGSPIFRPTKRSRRNSTGHFELE